MAERYDPTEKPVPCPEPSQFLGLLALGTLAAASTLKRKLKPSKSSEKETTTVS
ncbi:MAG: PEP-CTERM sorting domain-containing protein [Cytophagales bacterium]